MLDNAGDGFGEPLNVNCSAVTIPVVHARVGDRSCMVTDVFPSATGHHFCAELS